MKRKILQHLENWKKKSDRKSLIIKGARQIGKTTAIRQFGKGFKSLIEVNFERSPELHKLFEGSLAADHLISNLQLATSQQIIPGETLLFFDEVQACPRAIIALRYFYEELPELHVIAAGSLLQFALDHVGVPVGRVEFLHMYPMSFIEFLYAMDHDILADAITQHDITQPYNEAIHQKALRFLGEYIAIGGMPEAVLSWAKNKDYKACLNIHHNLLNAYQQDFEKYATKAQIKYVDHLYQQIPFHTGKQFRYSNITGEYRKRELEPALHLLEKASVVTKISYTAGQGIPLGAQANPGDFKLIPLDVALCQAALDVTAENWILNTEQAFINQGQVAESMVGQEILAYSNPSVAPSLYYWHRDKRGSEAEIDYLHAKHGSVIPIEVKAGKTGTLKSLHMFLDQHKDSPYGARFSTHNFSVYEKLHSYPLYAVSAFLRDDNA
ncbi:MAG: AAA family ATPase [Coxiellaceae bacterium]|nr:AAA family ATPase [Coxiellaceae bacterium]